MSVKISFADLTHTGQIVAANTFPLGITYVGSYAQQELGNEIDLELFKYPEDFANYLDHIIPQVAGFSSFTWNLRMHHEYAKRIKALSPETVMIFGGPHFPGSEEEQREFLEKFSCIDFFIEFEGEMAFVALYKALKEVDFDVARFKAERRQTPSLRYLVDDEFVRAPMADKITDLSILPSPHLSGASDKFYDDTLIPMMQSTRGCPYRCTFCWEGGSFFSKTKRFPQDRVRAELKYIAERVRSKVPDLTLVDANFGMFKEDLDTSLAIVEIQKAHQYNWPTTIITATAKNHKERTIEIVEILGETLPATAAVQTTNNLVLETIKRKNPSPEALNALAQNVDKNTGQSEAEIILCLPGDTHEAHFQSVFDMLDAGMTFIRMYQFMLLPGTEAASQKSIKNYDYNTRFRVLPRCFGRYRFRDETFPSAEVEEICISNNTMRYEDYQDCRDLNLTVEIFNNDSIFADVTRFLAQNGIKRSQWVEKVYGLICTEEKTLASLYTDYRAEEKKNLWSDLDKLESFTTEPNVVDRYIDGEYGTNELYKYRAIAVFEHLELLHSVALKAARQLLNAGNQLDALTDQYLTELARFGCLRKQDIFNTEKVSRESFHFDFVTILESSFTVNPMDYHMEAPMEIELYHTSQQKTLIEGYVAQYTTSLIGLGRILLRANMNRFYRQTQLPVTDDNRLTSPPVAAQLHSVLDSHHKI